MANEISRTVISNKLNSDINATVTNTMQVTALVSKMMTGVIKNHEVRWKENVGKK
jgi:hypothetical protein